MGAENKRIVWCRLTPSRPGRPPRLDFSLSVCLVSLFIPPSSVYSKDE
jgi:hypothetical protein